MQLLSEILQEFDQLVQPYSHLSNIEFLITFSDPLSVSISKNYRLKKKMSFSFVTNMK